MLNNSLSTEVEGIAIQKYFQWQKYYNSLQNKSLVGVSFCLTHRIILG